MADTVNKSAGLSARAAIPSVINGAGIRSIKQTETSAEDGGINVVTITTTEGEEVKFEVKNGSKGSQGLRGEKGDPGEVDDTIINRITNLESALGSYINDIDTLIG